MMGSRAGIVVILLSIGATAAPPPGSTALEQTAGAVPFAIFPLFVPGTGEFTGLSFVNTSAALNVATVTWMGPDGASIQTATLSLAPGSQHAALAREILGVRDDPAEGWIRVKSSEAGLLTYMSTGENGILDGSGPASAVSTKVILPHVSVNTGFMELEHTDTFVHLINPAPAAANAHAELVGLDGSIAGTLSLSIPAGGSRTLRVSESFRDALPSNNAGGRVFRGYISVSSDLGLAGWLRIDKPLSRGLQRGSGLEEIVGTPVAMASHFAFGSPALYLSELNIINPGDGTMTLELEAQDDRGAKIGETVRRTLNPGQGLREDVFHLFRIAVPEIYPPPLVTGYIRIRATDGSLFQVIGDIHITCRDQASMLYPIETTFPSHAIFPFAITDADYFTGYALANPNELLTMQTDVTIELLDHEGRTIGAPRIVSLSPAGRFVSLIDEKIRSGYLRIRANAPFAALGAIGSWNGSMLAPLPAERVPIAEIHELVGK